VKLFTLRRIVIVVAAVAAIAGAVLWWNGRHTGVVLDSYKGVAVYDNGALAFKSHGRHYSKSGYYWGQKWQCVEFVKRFYDQAKQHQMPDVWGHAKDFFDRSVPHGGVNQKRALLQFRNREKEMPQADDLLVFDGGYGHVAIVTEVGSNYVEVVQQNIYGKPRQRFEVVATNGVVAVGPRHLLGWLRKKG
jgi:surface antigen